MIMNEERVFHPIWDWEDYDMWRDISALEHFEYLEWAERFTADHEAYGSAMRRVLLAMPKACEHNLTEAAMNRRA
jgi:hypothetical protein